MAQEASKNYINPADDPRNVAGRDVSAAAVKRLRGRALWQCPSGPPADLPLRSAARGANKVLPLYYGRQLSSSRLRLGEHSRGLPANPLLGENFRFMSIVSARPGLAASSTSTRPSGYRPGVSGYHIAPRS